MRGSEQVVYCDNCNCGFNLRSVKIDKCFVNIDDEVLTLYYFMCPRCKSIYKVCVVDDRIYNDLKDELMSVRRRIRNSIDTGHLESVQVYKKAEKRKMARLKKYVSYMHQRYNGKFVIKENEIVYLPCGVTEL